MKKKVSKGALIAVLGTIGIGLAKAKSKTGSSSKELLAFRPSQWLEANKNLKMNGSQWVGVLRKKFPTKDELFMMEAAFQKLRGQDQQIFTGGQVLKLISKANIPQELIVRSDLRPVKTTHQIEYIKLKAKMEHTVANTLGYQDLPITLRDKLQNVSLFQYFSELLNIANEEEEPHLNDWLMKNQKTVFSLMRQAMELFYYEHIGETEYQTFLCCSETLGTQFPFDVIEDTGRILEFYDEYSYEQESVSQQQESVSQQQESVSQQQEAEIPDYIDIGASYGNKSLEIGVPFNILFNLKKNSKYPYAHGGAHFREGSRNVIHVRGEILKKDKLLIVEEIQSDWYQTKVGRQNPAFLNGSEKWASASIYASIQLAYDLGLDKVYFVDPETEKEIQGHGFVKEGIQYWYGKFIPKMVKKIASRFSIPVLSDSNLPRTVANDKINKPYGILIQGNLLEYLNRHRLSSYGPIRQQGFLQ